MDDPPQPDPADARPWEAPGAVRRDPEPHRGPLLLLLSLPAVIVGLVALLVPPLGVVGLGLAVVVRQLAVRDLADMDAGRVDPAGRWQTARAKGYASGAIGLALGGWLLWLVLVLGVLAF